MKPSPTLRYRIRTRLPFTTKRVGGDFYRGNRTGSLGAHTKDGNYIIDWRKVRHYVVPDLTSLKLTPFVSRDVYPDDRLHVDEDNVPYQAEKFGGLHYLRYWKYYNNNQEYNWTLEQEELKKKERQESEEQHLERATLSSHENAEEQRLAEQLVVEEKIEPEIRR